jgi:Trp operon repressor
MPIAPPTTNVSDSVAQEALSTEPSSTPEVRPDLSGHSKDELAAMLRADQGGSKTTPEPEVTPPAPETKQPDAPQVPTKFKNPDGSLNVDNLLKSYGEAEKTLGRQNQSIQDIELIKLENSELKQRYGELNQFKADLEAKMQASQQEQAEQTPTPAEWAGMTPQEQQAYIDQKVESKVTQLQQKQEAQREMDSKINASIAEVSKLEGYEHLKDDINAMLKSDIIDYHPDAPKIAYYAALGHKTPALLSQAKNMGFSEGYAKAKEEMGKVVDSGKATSPVNIEGMDEASLKKLSIDEHRKLLPRYNNDTYTL